MNHHEGCDITAIMVTVQKGKVCCYGYAKSAKYQLVVICESYLIVFIFYKTVVRLSIDNKYYVIGMGNSILPNETMRVESIKPH